MIIYIYKYKYVLLIYIYRLMKKETKKLQMEQMSSKLNALNKLRTLEMPEKGWIYSIRSTLGMSMRQMANRINKATPTVQKMENREAKGTITLKTLKEAAKAFDMKLVYGLVPIEGELRDIIEKRATEIAIEIVKRTNSTMVLEDQKVSNKRLNKEIKEITSRLVDEMPKMLWD